MTTHILFGMCIKTNPNLTIPGPVKEIPRTWRERLLTMPWRPWVKNRYIVTQIPSRQMYMLPDNTIVMHPELWEEVKHAVTSKYGDASFRPAPSDLIFRQGDSWETSTEMKEAV